jgi:hypothetical protein
MENTRIVYVNDQGNLAVVTPVANCGLTLEEIISRSIPADKEYHVIDSSHIPTDRSFRGAWVMGVNGVIEDIEKSKVIHLERIREYRNLKLEQLDKVQMIALSKDEPLDGLKDEKQSLRDLPQNILEDWDVNPIESIESLKAYIPANIDMPSYGE